MTFFIGIFTFSAPRGYELARFIKSKSNAVVVMGGMHASLNYAEAAEYCDYVLVSEGDDFDVRLTVYEDSVNHEFYNFPIQRFNLPQLL